MELKLLFMSLIWYSSFFLHLFLKKSLLLVGYKPNLHAFKFEILSYLSHAFSCSCLYGTIVDDHVSLIGEQYNRIKEFLGSNA